MLFHSKRVQFCFTALVILTCFLCSWFGRNILWKEQGHRKTLVKNGELAQAGDMAYMWNLMQKDVISPNSCIFSQYEDSVIFGYFGKWHYYHWTNRYNKDDIVSGKRKFRLCVLDGNLLSFDVFESDKTYKVRVNYVELENRITNSGNSKVHFVYMFSKAKYFGCLYEYNYKNLRERLVTRYEGKKKYQDQLKEDPSKFEAVISAMGFLDEWNGYECN